MTVKILSRAAFGALAFAYVDAAYAGSATWTGLAGDSLLNTTGNWTAGGPPTNSGDVATWDGIVGGNLTLNYNAAFGIQPLGTTINITGDQTGSLLLGTDYGSTFAIQNITIASGAGAFTIGDGIGSDGTVFRNNGAAEPYINTLVNNSTNTATFATNVTFASGNGKTRTLVFAGSGNWEVNSNLVPGGSGSFAVTKNDIGTLTLIAANTYNGATTINAGTLNLGGGTASGSITGLLVMAGGSLAYTTTGNPTNTFAGTSVSAGASALSVVTGNTLNIGTISRTAGATVNFDQTTGSGTFKGTATLVNSILRWASVSSAGTAAANSANGFTFATVTGGAVVPYTAATSNSFGWASGGAATVNYDVTGAVNSLGAARTANSVRYVGTADTIQKYYSVTLTLNALLNSSDKSVTLQPDSVANTPTLVIGNSNELILSAAAGPITIGMPITGASGAVTKTGTNTVTLTAANTYAGTTTISAGSLQIGNGGAAGRLSTSSTIINNGTLIINRSSAVGQGTDFSASAITGSGSLTQAGTGTTTLTAANTYSGATVVNGGALFVNGSLAGTVHVASGATLGGTNTITSAVTLTSGAILAPGAATNQIGTLTLSGTAPALSGRNLVADVSTTSGVCDKLVLTGTVDLTGLTVTVKIPGTLPVTNMYVLLSSTALSGTPTLAGDLSYPWYLSVKNNTLVLSKICGTMVSFF